MRKPNFKYPDTKSYQFVLNYFHEKSITQHDLAQLAYDMTSEFTPDVSIDHCFNIIEDVMHKRDYLSTAMVMINLDQLAEKHQLAEPLQSIITADAGVFGVDEDLAMSIATLYGPIGATNFGYLDRVKKGLIRRIDRDGSHINTFLDDLLGATVAAACGKISHEYAWFSRKKCSPCLKLTNTYT